MLYAAGLISFSHDLDEAAGTFREAARLAEECGDVELQLEALAQLSVVRCLLGRAAEAANIAEAVLAPALAYGTEWSVAEARVAVAVARCGLGDLEGAAEQLAQAEEVFVRAGLREGLATTRWAQAEVAYHAGDGERAAALSAAALRDTALGDDLLATVCRQAQHAHSGPPPFWPPWKHSAPRRGANPPRWNSRFWMPSNGGSRANWTHPSSPRRRSVVLP
ncbi:hypothetical protein ABZ924_19350 [Streptomyces sp. NPDC046876]|uniref:hypothetical protein n=1 Tax=Streptomyces sp. NPDC046876 TaxID=3155616 RepID=UPI0033F893A1